MTSPFDASGSARSPTRGRSHSSEQAEALLALGLLEVCLGKSFRLEVTDLQLGQGEVVAVIGANGSGKTTMMGAIAGTIDARVRQGTLLGVALDRWRTEPRLRRDLGVQLQDLRQHPWLRVGELLRLHEALHGQSAVNLVNLLGLGPLRNRRYGTLSQGQRQRVDIYLAIAHQPRFVILDEPTAGLDDRFRSVVYSLIAETGRSRQGILLFSTHLPGDLQFADRILWLRNGHLADVGTLGELIERHLSAFRGTLEYREAAQADQIGPIIADTLSAQVFRHKPRGVTVFCPTGMNGLFHEFALKPEVEAYSFRPTDAGDLLAHVSGAHA